MAFDLVSFLVGAVLGYLAGIGVLLIIAWRYGILRGSLRRVWDIVSGRPGA